MTPLLLFNEPIDNYTDFQDIVDKGERMLTNPKKIKNGRKKQNEQKNILILLILVALIIGVYYLLEKTTTLNSDYSGKPTNNIAQSINPEQGSNNTIQHRVSSSHSIVPSKHIKNKISGTGKIAIIVDDMGANLSDAKSLMSIELPITFSIIPALAKSKAVAELAHAGGGEVMIHIPMEPQGYPKQRVEKNGLLVSFAEVEIEGRMNSYFQTVPYASGANNHMGSRFTEYESKMKPVLTVLKEHDMYFVDSMTSPSSVGFDLAKSMGIAAGVRHVFLDNELSEAAIKNQLGKLTEIARKKGGAIAICHPHGITIKILTEMMPEMKKTGVNFVFASQLVN
jgi:polysaccharide deacetylase 2 family uncharacterized protein YibQ